MADKLEYANTYYNRGISYKKKGEFKRAIDAYTKAIDIQPDYLYAYDERAYCYFYLKNYEQSIKDFSKIWEIFPNSLTLIDRCNLYILMNEYDQAIKDCNFIIENSPELVHGYYFKGKILILKNEFEQALFYLNKSIELQPDYVEALLTRSKILFDKSFYEQAISDYLSAKNIDPEYTDVFRNKHSIYFNELNFDFIISEYNKAIEMQPDNAEFYNKTGNVYRYKEAYELAVSDYKKAIELNNDFIEAYVNLGNTYLDMGDCEQAIDIFSKIIKLNSDYSDAYFYRGNCHYANTKKIIQATIEEQNEQKQHRNLALLDYDEALLRNPLHAYAWLNRGRAYFSENINMGFVIIPKNYKVEVDDEEGMNNFNEGVKSYTEALRIAPYSVAIRLSYAQNCWNRSFQYNNIEDFLFAHEQYKKVLLIDPENEIALIKQRYLHVLKGEFDLAVEDLTEIIDKNPNNAEVLCRRAHVWDELLQKDLAEIDYKEAIKREPAYIPAYIAFAEEHYKITRAYAIDVYIEGLKNNPDNEELKKALQNKYKEIGDGHLDNADCLKSILGSDFQSNQFRLANDAYEKALNLFTEENQNDK